jgi:L-threonylcarbamoyladenylate synthase
MTLAVSLEQMEAAVKALRSGDVVGMPTETVYGLAGMVDSADSIEKIFNLKERPFFDPLIVHVASAAMAKTLTAEWSPLANFLAEHFWPGPLTLVLPKAASVNPMITSGLETVGIRMPKHSVALSLIDRLGKPLAAPSANLFGRTSPTTAEHVKDEFPSLLVLDGGACEIGVESTVLQVNRKDQIYELSILRPGSVTRAELEKSLLGQRHQFQFVDSSHNKVQAPGQMKHHYMPKVPLVLVKDPKKNPDQILIETKNRIALMPAEIDGVKIQRPKAFLVAHELTLPSEGVLAARLLYAKLREIQDADILFFRLRPEHTVDAWIATMDRLTKAASLTLE